MATVDVWVCAGQSNMAGRGNSAQSPVPDPALAWQYNYSGGFIDLADPIGSGVNRAQTGSMVPAFAKAYTAVSARPSVFVPVAKGGTALLSANANANGHWGATGTLFSSAVNHTLDAIEALIDDGHDLGVVNVLWHQGERDAQGGSSLGNYQAQYSNLVSRFRNALAEPGLKVYALQLGKGSPDTSGWQTVRNAQLAATVATSGLEMAYDQCQTFFARGWMKLDNLHYSQVGLNDMGLHAATYAALDQGYPPPPLPVIRRSGTARHLWMTWQPREAS